MPNEKDKKLEFLKREEIKTMIKDIDKIQEEKAKIERERIAKLKTEEEEKIERERLERAKKEAEERKVAEREAKKKEEELKKLRKEREEKERLLELSEEEVKKIKTEKLREKLREIQVKEEKERKEFLERVEAKLEGKEEIKKPTLPPPPHPAPPAKVLRFLPRKPSLVEKIWIRIVISLLILAILALIFTFWYWFFVVKEEALPVIEEKIIPETPETPKPEIPKLLINERILNFGYRIPSPSRTIDTIIIHSVYNALIGDPYDIEGVIEEYKTYGVATHYLITREGAIYQTVPDKAIAYHAGISKMPDGRTGVNNFSIGIELIYTKEESPNEAQYQSLAQLVKYLKQQNNIPPENILGHKDIAPERKTDPWNFNWEYFNQLTK